DISHNSERARDYAISLAAEYNAELILFHVAENASDLATADASVAERTQEPDILVSEKTIVRFGKVYQEIVRQAKEGHASLIVITEVGGDSADPAVFGSTYRVFSWAMPGARDPYVMIRWRKVGVHGQHHHH
ncbi:MAG: universal stress protein, partial [Acidobacteria bacterium]|nr:universal stress protein [Acidobacteriota bacterium]